MSALSISQLFLYPLKSAAGIGVPQIDLDQRGPSMDRRYMVVDEHDRFITQRQHAKMCLINTQLCADSLELSAPDQPLIHVANPNASDGSDRLVTVWRDTVKALDCGKAASRWLTQFLGFKARLVFMPETTKRPVDSNFAKNQEIVGFADAFPLLLCSEESLADFNLKLSSPITMNRFRPNIVIRGAKPWAEDSWSEIQIGTAKFTVASACSRCIVPSIDQATASKQNEVIDALNTFRRRGTSSYFGQNLLHQSRQTIKLGDPVTVLNKT